MLYLKKKKEKNLQISLFYSKNLYGMIYISWDVECNKLKLVIWVIFCAFNPQNQNQSFEKLKKASGDVIILQMCTKIHDHMMYASWDMECNMHNFLSLLAIFCPFTQLLTPKINIWKKCQKKKTGDIILLQICSISEDHMMYVSWDTTHGRQFFVILGHFLHFDPPNNPKNQNFEKMKKNTWRHCHFTLIYHK